MGLEVEGVAVKTQHVQVAAVYCLGVPFSGTGDVFRSSRMWTGLLSWQPVRGGALHLTLDLLTLWHQTLQVGRVKLWT